MVLRKLQGIAASSGIAIGPAYLYLPAEIVVERRKVTDTATEEAKLAAALEACRTELNLVHRGLFERLGEDEARIIEAQLLILEDPALIDRVKEKISGGINVELAVEEVIASYAALMEDMEDEYLRARGADIRDVGNRLLRHLLGLPSASLAELREPSVVVARDLAPSDTAQLDKELVLGFGTSMGGTTSHTAILARMLGIPAVVGIGAELLSIRPQQQLVLDGKEGVVIVEPDSKTIEHYLKERDRSQEVQEKALAVAHQPAITTDGHQVEAVANIGDVRSAEEALSWGAEGVGLFRTEFLFLEARFAPSEEEQYQAYWAVAELMGERPLVIRTLDIGGDKKLPYLQLDKEMNPFLGCRAVRLSLRRRELFKAQLRAILRAGVGANVKVMFPMIAVLEELRAAKEVLEEAKTELEAEGMAHAERLEVGIMVEIPSAVIGADLLAPEVDFFSIGTNDLIQYAMACDRTNEQVGYLYEPFHPVVLRLIQWTIEAGHSHGKWVGMCGEMAGNLEAIPILLGLGLDEFSMNARAIPQAKALIRSLSLSQAQEIARETMMMTDAAQIQNYVRERMAKLN